MKSDYLISAEDIEPGDTVIADGYIDDPVTVVSVNQIYAKVRTDKGYEWSIVRNRLSKIQEERSR